MSALPHDEGGGQEKLLISYTPDMLCCVVRFGNLLVLDCGNW